MQVDILCAHLHTSRLMHSRGQKYSLLSPSVGHVAVVGIVITLVWAGRLAWYITLQRGLQALHFWNLSPHYLTSYQSAL